jgi:signal transduction histidine kinase/DNA-binding response OmpR family regulator/HPt (histidine-containing phosphotransfer) domain-containing protein
MISPAPGDPAPPRGSRVSVLVLFVGVLVTLATLVLGGSAVLAYRSESRNELEQLQRELAASTEQLATSLALPVWNFDHAQTTRILDHVMENQAIQEVSLQMQPDSGENMARYRGPGGTVQAAADPRSPLGAPAPPGTIVAERPVIYAGKTIGGVRMVCSTRFLAVERRAFLGAQLRSMLVLDLLLVAGVSLILWGSILHPLGELQRLAMLVSSGTMEESPAPTGYYFGELAALHGALLRTFGLLKERYSALKRSEDHLEDLVAVRTAQLERARSEAETANAAKSAFLANMSHEVRTPMNAIIGLTHLALTTDRSDKQRQYLAKAKGAAENLLRILNDILDFSKIEAGKLQMEAHAFCLEDVLEKITHLPVVQVNEKHLELLVDLAADVPKSLVGDALRLGQVLTNLFSNAVKFTEAGEIVLTVQRASALDDQVVLQFSVRDSGIGIGPEQVPLLFQPFSQGDASSTRKFGGTGLGLAISKHLVEMMGGRIWVRTTPGKGSEFTFTASFGIDRAHPEPRAATPEALGTLNILVVDDNQDALAIIRRMLADLGYEARVASSAEEALATLRLAAGDRPYDLVLVDCYLSEVDGFEVARRIRQQGLPLPPKIVLMTAYGDGTALQGVESEGVDGCLAKPVTPSDLLDVIMNVFGKRAHRRQLTAAASGPSAADVERITGAHVLLVEDNDFNQLVAMDLLALMGVQATLAMNGREAVEKVKDGHFQAVLMDLQMPEMDGYEATRQLRADPAFAGLPILAMTAHAMVRERERCLALGMNDYLTKPINPSALANTLARWILQGPQPSPSPASARPAPGLPQPAGGAGISWEQGLANYAGHVAIYQDILHKFMELNGVRKDQVRSALARGETETAERAAHSMIAAAGTIGALALADTARLLQDAIRTGSSERLATVLDQYEDDLVKVLEELQSHFDQGSS